MSIVLPDWLKDYIPGGDIVFLGKGCIWIKGERDCKVKFSESTLGSQLLQREALWLERVGKTKVSTNNLQDLFKDANRTVMITDYIHGLSASNWLKKHPSHCFEKSSDTYTQLVRYVESLFNSIDCLHSSKIVHGDIKPGNVIFSEDGSSYLIDFSNARRFREPLTIRGLTQYTPSYQYPASGDFAKFEQDYYALVVMLTVLLTEDWRADNAAAAMSRLLVRDLGLSEEHSARLECYISYVRKDLCL